MIAFPVDPYEGIPKEYLNAYNGTMAALEDFYKKHAPLSFFDYEQQKSYFASEYSFMREVEKIARERDVDWGVALEMYQFENKVEIDPAVKEKFLQDMIPRWNY